MLSTGHTLTIILVVAVCTFLTRLFPFALFGKNKTIPPIIKYLGLILPPCIIGILVIYCLKEVSLLAYPYGLPQLIAIGVVAILHLWKHNALLSIGTGTVLYMFLIQQVF